MKTPFFKNIFLIIAVIVFSSCEDHLTELNVNPNGVDPSVVNPNLVLPTIITGTADPYLKMNYDGDVAGVMQYVSKTGWGGGLYNLEWREQRGWGTWYNNLRNVGHLIEKAEDEDMEFQKGAAIVLRAFNFGYIVDSWGPAPYTEALNAPAGKQEDFFPPFDSQETIYKGIIEELKEANNILSKSASQYFGINPSADLIYEGKPAQWRKFANSLMLRYYMRVSEKLPSYAKAGIEEIMSNPSQFPIFSSIDDDATMGYIGTYGGDSWPNTIEYDASHSGFDRVILCAGLRDYLMERDDPRIGVWFNPVEVKIEISTEYEDQGGDVVIDGVRYITPDYIEASGLAVYDKETWISAIEANKALVDTNLYVGPPVAYSQSDASTYNLNPAPIQGGPNIHTSALDDIYKAAKGDKLLARLISYTEVCFILAEAAQKGWSVGASQQEWYERGIKASFDTWDISDKYAAYLNEDDVAYDGSLKQIIEQKWIANWTVAHEAWCDWRRTGYPELKVGPLGQRKAIPLRYQYGGAEISRNYENYLNAISTFQETSYTAQDGKDSSWSKFWLLQGTNKPY